MTMLHPKTMKLAIIMLLLMISAQLSAQTYVPTDKGSRVEFALQQGTGDAITKVKGSLSNLYGLIQFDPQQLGKASFDISLSAGTMRCADKVNEFRLRGTEFFNVSHYPVISIKSTSVTQDRPGGVVYILSGMLTLKGMTKPVKIQLTAMPSGTGFMFRGLLQFSRQAFGIGEKGEFDDKVAVYLQINTTKK